MSVKNNTQNTKIQRNEIAANLPVEPWETEPGGKLLVQSSYSNIPLNIAISIFKKVITEKIPYAAQLLKKLGRIDHSLKEIHLPLPIRTIFFTFLDELVEHYQNQIEQRDISLDQEFNKLKQLLAKNHTQIWPKDNNEIQAFMDLLKTKLIQVDAKPETFDQMVALWSEILNIQYIANMTLCGVWLPSNYTSSHRLPTSPEKESSNLQMNIKDGQLLEAYSLIVHQMSKDLDWILQIMVRKLSQQLPSDELEKEFFRLTLSGHVDPEIQRENLTVYQMVLGYVVEMRSIIKDLSSLDLRDNAAIKTIENRLDNVNVMICDKATDYESTLTILKAKPDESVEIKGTKMTLDHPLFSTLMEYSECVKLKYNYLDTPTYALMFVLQAIRDSNEKWEQYEKEGKKERILPSTSGTVIEYFDHEKVANELLTPKEKPKQNSSNSNKNKNKEAKASNASNKKKDSPKNGSKATTPTVTPYAPTNTTTTSKTSSSKSNSSSSSTSSSSSSSSTSSTSSTSTSTTTSSAAPSLTRVERLRAKLVELYEQNPSKSLRQVIWHLDHLAVIQKTLAKSASSAPQHLSLLTTVAASAQKIMEQAYRFRLKQEQVSYTRTHNLKEYHREYDPNFKDYPLAVEQLFLANNWVRYFFTNQRNWYFTTLNVNMPAVLDKLFKIADGRQYSVQELKATVQEIVENSCELVEELLEQDSTAPKSTASLPPVKNTLNAFPEQMFAGILQNLQTFQSALSTNHPLLLKVKQAVAALKMLEVSIRQMNKAVDVQELSTWTVSSLLQLQESIETILHCIEHYKTGSTSIQHELGTLAKTLGLNMGALADYTEHLSYMVRYLFETNSDSLAFKIISDLEALKLFPELADGFQLQNTPKMLSAQPSPDISLKEVVANMKLLLSEAQKFLKETAVPVLQNAHQASLTPPTVTTNSSSSSSTTTNSTTH